MTRGGQTGLSVGDVRSGGVHRHSVQWHGARQHPTHTSARPLPPVAHTSARPLVTPHSHQHTVFRHPITRVGL